MKDQVIEFITAKLAKDKKFNFTEIEFRDSNTLKVVDNVKKRLEYFKTKEEANLIQIPAQSLLQRWLREKHNLLIQMYTWKDHAADNNEPVMWKSEIGNSSFLALSYEEALEEGLKQALNLIKI